MKLRFDKKLALVAKMLSVLFKKSTEFTQALQVALEEYAAEMENQPEPTARRIGVSKTATVVIESPELETSDDATFLTGKAFIDAAYASGKKDYWVEETFTVGIPSTFLTDFTEVSTVTVTYKEGYVSFLAIADKENILSCTVTSN